MAAKHGGVGAPAPKTSATPVPKVGKGKKKTGGAKGLSTGISGRIAMEEYWGVCSKGSNQLNITPGKSHLPRLDQYAYMYEQYKILSWQVRFTVRVGSTVSGMYLAGPTYIFGDEAKTLHAVSALEPKVHSAVWQGSNLVVPASRLMKQTWMYVPGIDLEDHADSHAGSVWVFVDGDKAQVDAWVSYSVEFSGPTSNRSGHQVLIFDGKSWTMNGKAVTSLPDMDTSFALDIEATDDSVLAHIQSWFAQTNVVDNIKNGSLRLWHVLVDHLNATTLSAMTVPVTIHMVRRPFLTAPGFESSARPQGQGDSGVEEAGGPARSGQRCFDPRQEGLGIQAGFREPRDREISLLCQLVSELGGGSRLKDLGIKFPDQGSEVQHQRSSVSSFETLGADQESEVFEP